ncbi:hypothetical protein LOK49_LG04G02065 [Camellia lanceoleosa]|uniref:Uncharacterized protein n=1 Tax=Camellia lanceoleosa TaxID=1840588 RepID=A0ACC0I8M2_9ERIC|nr:hypothetical protein LOK49_LG04G02065 [Camellia lanceoleosa]
MSDTESQTSQFDSFHSRSDQSPFRSDDPDPPPTSLRRSPSRSSPSTTAGKAPEALPAPVVVFNRSVREEEVAAGVTKVGGVGGGDGVYGSGLEDGVGGDEVEGGGDGDTAEVE